MPLSLTEMLTVVNNSFPMNTSHSVLLYIKQPSFYELLQHVLGSPKSEAFGTTESRFYQAGCLPVVQTTELEALMTTSKSDHPDIISLHPPTDS